MKKFLFQSFTFVVISMALMACNNGNEKKLQQKSADGESKDSISQNSSNETTKSLIQFPENYEEGVLYTTVTRGSAFEELYTSRETIEAVQNGEPIPSGTIITLKIYENEELDRIFVMEKRNDWDPEHLSDQRNGEWAYQNFTPEGTVNEKENIGRCISCHAGQESDDFLHKLDEMKTYDLEALTGMNDISSSSQFTDSHIEGWGVMEVDADSGESLTQEDQGRENFFKEDYETKEILQNVLMRMYINELEG